MAVAMEAFQSKQLLHVATRVAAMILRPDFWRVGTARSLGAALFTSSRRVPTAFIAINCAAIRTILLKRR